MSWIFGPHQPPSLAADDACLTCEKAVAADVDEERASGPARDPAADGLQRGQHQRPIQPAVEAEDFVRCTTAGQQGLGHGELVAIHRHFAGLGRGDEEGEMLEAI